MLENSQDIKTGENATAKVTTTWSPYTPTDLDVQTDEVTLTFPDFDSVIELADWCDNNIFGLGQSITVDKYLTSDIELLNMQLEQCIIDRNALTFMNWIYHAVVEYTPKLDDKEIPVVFQTQEDFFRSFGNVNQNVMNVSRIAKNSGKIMLMTDISVFPICRNPDKLPESTMRSLVVNFKLLVLMVMANLSVMDAYQEKKKEYPVEYDDVMSACKNVCNVLTMNFFTNDNPEKLTILKSQGYLSKGKEYQLKMYFVELEKLTGLCKKE